MPQPDQLARPRVCGRAGFHANEARSERLEEAKYLRASQPPLDDDLAGRVDAVNLKPVLGQVETDRGNLDDGRLLSIVAFSDDHVLAH